MGVRALRSGREKGREIDLKKVFRLSTWTAVNCSGKSDLAAMAEVDELNGPADAAEPLRKVACCVPIIDSSIEGEPDRFHWEVDPSQQPTATPGPQKRPPPLAPNLSHHVASIALNQLQLRTSAEHFLMRDSGA